MSRLPRKSWAAAGFAFAKTAKNPAVSRCSRQQSVKRVTKLYPFIFLSSRVSGVVVGMAK
jgi:hypothetical protein